MAGFDEHFAILDALPAKVEAAALVAVHAALDPVYEASQDVVPVAADPIRGHAPGLLKSTGLVQVEATPSGVDGRISYGNDQTLSGWGGANSAGFGARKGSKKRKQGPIWENVGYEVFIHEGVVDSATGTHPPRKFLEIPLLEEMPEMEEAMGHAYQAAFEANI